jgi:hypothetical protein
MMGPGIGSVRFALPLPRFVQHPASTMFIAAVHVYLASGHLSKLLGGQVEWTHAWKGFGALAGAYVFAALATRTIAARRSTPLYVAPSLDETPVQKGSS